MHRLNSAYFRAFSLVFGDAKGSSLLLRWKISVLHGWMDIVAISWVPWVLLEMMRVGYLVQRPPATGNGISVKLCSSDDLPAD